MKYRHRQQSSRLASKATELAFAAPQVVAHRLMRMALAGVLPDAHDRQEFNKMGSEKVAAFYESWNAMFLHAARAQYELGSSLLQSMWLPWLAPANAGNAAKAYLNSMTQGLWGKGLAPVHRRAVANAKRLGRSKN